MARCRKFRKQMVRTSVVMKDSAGHRMYDKKTGAPIKEKKKVVKEKTTVCYGQARQFFRVKYSELFPYRKNESTFEDTIGLCDLCAAGMTDATSWNHRTHDEGYIVGIRGIVRSVELITEPNEVFEEQYKVERKVKMMEEIKADFMRKMQQKNTACMSLDDWRQVFDKAMEDFVVMGVQNT